MPGINPKVVSWAAHKIGLPLQDIPKKLKVSPKTFEKWQKGEKVPSYNRLKDLSRLLRIPVGYLFLKEPPKEWDLPLPDFRSGPGYCQKPSPELMETLQDALRKQEWFKEYCLREGYRELSFVGQFSLKNSPEEVAQNIREILQLEPPGKRPGDPTSWFRQLVHRVEELRILVLRNSVVGHNTHRPLSPQEFRGFVLVDKIAPLIFINTRDAQKAQIFTLFHELAHIWIGRSALTDVFIETTDFKYREEVFCNQVAAETLVPKESFIKLWNPSKNLNENLRRTANTFKVSTLVVLRRAFDLNFVGKEEFEERIKEELARITEKESGGGGGYATIFSRNSIRLTQTLLNEVMAGNVSYMEATRLLKISWQTVVKLINKNPKNVRF